VNASDKQMRQASGSLSCDDALKCAAYEQNYAGGDPLQAKKQSKLLPVYA
jgi:hypothetical protein